MQQTIINTVHWTTQSHHSLDNYLAISIYNGDVFVNIEVRCNQASVMAVQLLQWLLLGLGVYPSPNRLHYIPRVLLLFMDTATFLYFLDVYPFVASIQETHSDLLYFDWFTALFDILFPLFIYLWGLRHFCHHLDGTNANKSSTS